MQCEFTRAAAARTPFETVTRATEASPSRSNFTFTEVNSCLFVRLIYSLWRSTYSSFAIHVSTSKCFQYNVNYYHAAAPKQLLFIVGSLPLSTLCAENCVESGDLSSEIRTREIQCSAISPHSRLNHDHTVVSLNCGCFCSVYIMTKNIPGWH